MAVHNFLKSHHDRPGVTGDHATVIHLSPHPNPFLQLGDKPDLGDAMELTFITELGESYVIEIDENMELENVMALLEAEVSSSSRICSLVRYCWILVVLEFVRAQLIVDPLPFGRSLEFQWPNKAFRMKEETFRTPKPP